MYDIEYEMEELFDSEKNKRVYNITNITGLNLDNGVAIETIASLIGKIYVDYLFEQGEELHLENSILHILTVEVTVKMYQINSNNLFFTAVFETEITVSSETNISKDFLASVRYFITEISLFIVNLLYKLESDYHAYLDRAITMLISNFLRGMYVTRLCHEDDVIMFTEYILKRYYKNELNRTEAISQLKAEYPIPYMILCDSENTWLQGSEREEYNKNMTIYDLCRKEMSVYRRFTENTIMPLYISKNRMEEVVRLKSSIILDLDSVVMDILAYILIRNLFTPGTYYTLYVFHKKQEALVLYFNGKGLTIRGKSSLGKHLSRKLYNLNRYVNDYLNTLSAVDEIITLKYFPFDVSVAVNKFVKEMKSRGRVLSSYSVTRLI